MIRIKRLTFSIVLLFQFFCIDTAEPATVQTRFGERAGDVIVRSFDHLVVTIITPGLKLYQFAAADVDSVTSEEKTLVGVNTYLRKTPSEAGETIVMLNRGLEVKITDEKKEENGVEWIKVKAWGENEGWIVRDILTDKVVFTPEEKRRTVVPAPRPSRPEVKAGTGENGNGTDD